MNDHLRFWHAIRLEKNLYTLDKIYHSPVFVLGYVAQLHNFYAAPAPTLLFSKQKFFKE
jgi:hypothetical protein